MTQSRGRAVILVTGMSGPGSPPSMLRFAAVATERSTPMSRAGSFTSERRGGLEPMWDLHRVRELLDAHRSGWLFVAGCVANQGASYDDFDAVVLLSAPIDVIVGGVREGANPFGSRMRSGRRSQTRLAEFERLLRAGADREIRTTASVAEVAAVLERIAAGQSVRAADDG